LLTISPKLLEQLNNSNDKVDKILCTKLAKGSNVTKRPNDLTENDFRYLHNEDAMAVEKLAEGIRKFAVDSVKLEKMLLNRL